MGVKTWWGEVLAERLVGGRPESPGGRGCVLRRRHFFLEIGRIGIEGCAVTWRDKGMAGNSWATTLMSPCLTLCPPFCPLRGLYSDWSWCPHDAGGFPGLLWGCARVPVHAGIGEYPFCVPHAHSRALCPQSSIEQMMG